MENSRQRAWKIETETAPAGSVSLLEIYSGHFSDFAGQSRSPDTKTLRHLGFRDLPFAPGRDREFYMDSRGVLSAFISVYISMVVKLWSLFGSLL